MYSARVCCVCVCVVCVCVCVCCDTKDSPQVQWFWNCVYALTKEEQAKFLIFTTGARVCVCACVRVRARALLTQRLFSAPPFFTTTTAGTAKVPLGGFKDLEGMRGPQKFNVHLAYGGGNRLPTAHTCFNQLDLPQYGTEEKLREKLRLAISCGSEGYAFG
jgi:E3 ubiquitin-protein ligase HUWE1